MRLDDNLSLHQDDQNDLFLLHYLLKWIEFVQTQKQ